MYNGATANLETVSRLNLLQKSFVYHADGNVSSEKDGLNQATGYANYRRGIPQNVSFADGMLISAVVNNLGGLDSVTDATGATSTFGYDAMGRFASISYPGGDPVNWNATTMSFQQVASPELDLPAGHWRQTITTGTGIETNYFDAFWRPVYSQRYDNNDRAATGQVLKYQYDAEGRIIFASYPVRAYGPISVVCVMDTMPLAVAFSLKRQRARPATFHRLVRPEPHSEKCRRMPSGEPPV